MSFPGPKESVTVKRRVAGTVNPAGEAAESWSTISTGTQAHIQPVTISGPMGVAPIIAGQTRTSTHFIVFSPGDDVNVDDRVVDSSDNNYVIDRTEPWSTHLETYASITDIQ